ncbi:MAG: AraC family transcriptional regulator [Actinomycetota bacterium]|nr:AraC family transcriptional regulator [Actinomycetota bacterium]
MLFDVPTPAPVASVEVAWPSDDRARQVADALAVNPADDRDTAAWARLVGTSDRTLAGCSSPRPAAASANGVPECGSAARWNCSHPPTPVAVVAHRVGYRTASAFVAAFRRVLGVTPAQCFSQGSGLAAEWVV